MTVTSQSITVNDFSSAEEFLAAIDQTIKPFNDGDIVEGIIVKVDRDEVLLDIGYKTEGIIPSWLSPATSPTRDMTWSWSARTCRCGLRPLRSG